MKRFLHKLLGDRGERAAARFLKQQGFRILARQHRSRQGEIDLIALEGQQIVFVEVKTRRTTDAGTPTEAVTPSKQKKIAGAALAWLKQQRRLEQPVRFDVVSVLWPDDDGSPKIQHIRHAFEAPGPGHLYG